MNRESIKALQSDPSGREVLNYHLALQDLKQLWNRVASRGDQVNLGAVSVCHKYMLLVSSHSLRLVDAADRIEQDQGRARWQDEEERARILAMPEGLKSWNYQAALEGLTTLWRNVAFAGDGLPSEPVMKIYRSYMRQSIDHRSRMREAAEANEERRNGA